MKLKNSLLFGIGISVFVATAYAENFYNSGSGDPVKHPEEAQAELLDDTNSVVINGMRIHKDEIVPEIDLRTNGPDTGILVLRASGVPSDLGGFWDAGVESVGRNGVIGAAAEENGIGVVGITMYSNNAAIYGAHSPSSGDGSGQGVRGVSDSAGGVGVLGMNFGGGLAGEFVGGDVAQTLPNNGIVKAWAKIKADGTVHSCYNCDLDTAVTVRVAPGGYRVAFTPLGDISGRPRTATLDTHGVGIINGEIGLATDALNPNAVYVHTTDSVGAGTDKSFTAIIY